ncbi:hypothetical protein NKH84_30450 [Mesorhizobium sp. M0902]|uniref:hypothetical protein n=1 Tax=Mesorhizobium sp. M0902 TaxID=2957021 RepID=UPI00333B257C
MTTDTPLTRYSATNDALASGFVTAELHHLMGHDLTSRSNDTFFPLESVSAVPEMATASP